MISQCVLCAKTYPKVSSISLVIIEALPSPRKLHHPTTPPSPGSACIMSLLSHKLSSANKIVSKYAPKPCFLGDLRLRNGARNRRIRIKGNINRIAKHDPVRGAYGINYWKPWDEWKLVTLLPLSYWQESNVCEKLYFFLFLSWASQITFSMIVKLK